MFTGLRRVIGPAIRTAGLKAPTQWHAHYSYSGLSAGPSRSTASAALGHRVGPCRRDRHAHTLPLPAVFSKTGRLNAVPGAIVTGTRVQETRRRSGAHGSIVTGTP